MEWIDDISANDLWDIGRKYFNSESGYFHKYALCAECEKYIYMLIISKNQMPPYGYGAVIANEQYMGLFTIARLGIEIIHL
ncbi:MAG: hypothetical protein LBB56_08115 [Chitinispirillales bacterium]|nr:hypothetical protein [Chitinispirillales bacterium]